MLNAKGAITPEEYRKSLRGVKYTKREWQGHNVIKILDNRAYTGDGIHNRYYTSKIGKKVIKETSDIFLNLLDIILNKL